MGQPTFCASADTLSKTVFYPGFIRWATGVASSGLVTYCFAIYPLSSYPLMPHFSQLRVLALASTTWLAISCGRKEDAPQPQPPTPIPSLSKHTVAVRYQARQLGGALTGLPKHLNLLVEYERVLQVASTGYQLLQSTAQLHDLAVSDTLKDVPLPWITTYPNAIQPKVTVSLWEDQETPTVANTPYEITCEVVLDGKVAGHTTYSVVAGQLPPLVASSQTEVMP
jgi:hypothetical protein